jgi:hypothetical protein
MGKGIGDRGWGMGDSEEAADSQFRGKNGIDA